MQLGLDALERLLQRRARRHIVRVGVDLDVVERAGRAARQRIELGDAVDLVAEQFHAPGAVFVMRRENVDRVAAHAERAAHEIVVVAPVLQRRQVAHQVHAVDSLAARNGDGGARIGLHRADAVDARDRGDDDDVVALQDRARRRMAHAVDLLVHRGILLDIGVGARDIGFRLVVVVVGDEILDRVLRKEVLELAVELGRQRLVGREDQRGALHRLDHLRHGEGLARAGDAEQHLVALVGVRRFDQFLDRGRLVAGRLIFADQLEPDAAFGLFGPRRAMRHETGKLGTRRAMQRQVADRHDVARLRRAGIVGGSSGLDGQGVRRSAELGRSFAHALGTRAPGALARNRPVIVCHRDNIVRVRGLCSPCRSVFRPAPSRFCRKSA